MKTTGPELGLERLLKALEQELLDATDEEISAVATELGMRPEMKGSIALFGVTRVVRWNQRDTSKQGGATKGRGSKTGSRRRPKGDAPSSS